MRKRAAYAGALTGLALLLASCASTGAAQAPVPVASAWRPALFVDGYGATGLGPTPTDSTLDDATQKMLATLGILQSDLPSTLTAALATDGTSLTVASMSYCNGTFASEDARVARRRTVVKPETAVPTATSEVVYYRTVADASTALSELRGVMQECPEHRTASDSTTTLALDTVSSDKVDLSGLVPSDRRVVLSVNVTPAGTESSAYRIVRVWQQRGRVLVGILYSGAGTDFTDADRTNLHLLTAAVAARLDALPSSFTGTG
ncbi:MAG TPA: hypothetical protein VFL59_16560 [Candidatus Nanopelagicales bacterium]|nr:hypothetical protein [Candidatus Nanopelagicales bacterium]